MEGPVNIKMIQHSVAAQMIIMVSIVKLPHFAYLNLVKMACVFLCLPLNITATVQMVFTVIIVILNILVTEIHA